MESIPYGYCKCGCGEKTRIAPQNWPATGIRKGEPFNYVYGHRNRRPTLERFWEKVDRRGPEDCWLWQGACKPNVHPLFHVSQKRGRTRCHIFAAELAYGPVPPGLQVNHHCDTPACCNPRHLYYGTQLDNMRDAAIRGRRNFHRKYSDEEVLEILTLLESGLSRNAISRHTGMSLRHIYDIEKRKQRRDVRNRFFALTS